MAEISEEFSDAARLLSVEEILDGILPAKDYIDVEAVAVVDLKRVESRKLIADDLRAKRALLVAPRIFAYLDPIRKMMLSPHGAEPFIQMPSPHRTALALGRQNGWKLGMPLSLAKFLLCLSDRPTTINQFPYDQIEPRKYEKAGVEFHPMAPEIRRLSAAGQVLALALPKDAAADTLKEIGLTAMRGPLGTPGVFRGLIRDEEQGYLNERELVVAEIIKSNFDSIEIPLRAPVDWVPPEDHDSAPFIDQWWIFHVRQGNYHCLAADRMEGHPVLGRGRLENSSPLLWIDERSGWARTMSRIYRLGQKKHD